MPDLTRRSVVAAALVFGALAATSCSSSGRELSPPTTEKPIPQVGLPTTAP